jgi:hypothetical protein
MLGLGTGKSPAGALAALGVVLLAGCATDHGGTPGMRLRHQVVTLWSDQDEGQPALRVAAGQAIPYRPGTSCYRWHMTFERFDGTANIVELLTLPGPAPQWNSSQDTAVSKDRTSGRTRLAIDGSSGEAGHTWCVAEGDPVGTYRYDLFQTGEKIGSLIFRVDEVP